MATLDYDKIHRLSIVADQLMNESVKIDLEIDSMIGSISDLTVEQCEALMPIVGAGVVRGDVRARYKALTGRVWKPTR